MDTDKTKIRTLSVKIGVHLWTFSNTLRHKVNSYGFYCNTVIHQGCKVTKLQIAEPAPPLPCTSAPLLISASQLGPKFSFQALDNIVLLPGNHFVGQGPFFGLEGEIEGQALFAGVNLLAAIHVEQAGVGQ